MNVKYHGAIGIAGSLLLQDPLFLLGSIIPDLPLIPNEVKLIKNKQNFNAYKVDKYSFSLYLMSHSAFFCAFVALFCPLSFWTGYLLHVICDLFTHSGRFTARPFFPLYAWRFPWGKNILK